MLEEREGFAFWNVGLPKTGGIQGIGDTIMYMKSVWPGVK